MERVAIYARISSDRSGQQAGVTRQENECRDFAIRRNLQVVAVEQDNDTSAFKQKNRPGWNKLLKLVRAGEIDGIVVWHSDRLYRRIADLGVLVALVKNQGVKIYSVMGGDMDLSTASGILQAELLASVAGYEIRHKSERQVAKARELARAGLWNGGRTPIGYRKHPTEKGMLVVEPREAEVMREARRMLLSGHGMVDTLRWVRAEVVPGNPARKTLTPTSLRNQLISPTIAGKRVYIPQAEREAWDERRAAHESLPSDYVIQSEHILPGRWEPIFSEDEWKSIVSFLTKPERRNPGRAPKSLLSGVLVCGLCGSKMGYSTNRDHVGKVTPKPSYKCANDTYNCKGVGVSAEAIEQYMTGIVRAMLDRSAPFEIGLPSIRSLPDMNERDRLEALRREFLDMFELGRIPRIELDERLSKISDSISRIDAEEGEMLRTREEMSALNNSIARWESLDTAERRTLFKRLFVKVTMLPAGRDWGPTFQPLRVVPWWADGKEPDLAAAAARFDLATIEQRERVELRKAKAWERRSIRRGGAPGEPGKK